MRTWRSILALAGVFAIEAGSQPRSGFGFRLPAVNLPVRNGLGSGAMTNPWTPGHRVSPSRQPARGERVDRPPYIAPSPVYVESTPFLGEPQTVEAVEAELEDVESIGPSATPVDPSPAPTLNPPTFNFGGAVPGPAAAFQAAHRGSVWRCEPAGPTLSPVPVATRPDTSGVVRDRQPEDPVSVPRFFIALKNKSVYTAISSWTQGQTLHYLTPAGSHNQVSLELVDWRASARLNGNTGPIPH